MIRRLAISILCCLLLAAPAVAADWGPWQPRRHPAAASKPADGLNPLVLGVKFFQHYISRVDGPRCPMYPTCSAYALQALHRHGPLTGTFLTVDRLLHELEPDARRELIRVGGRLRYNDPLERNDFWLTPGAP